MGLVSRTGLDPPEGLVSPMAHPRRVLTLRENGGRARTLAIRGSVGEYGRVVKHPRQSGRSGEDQSVVAHRRQGGSVGRGPAGSWRTVAKEARYWEGVSVVCTLAKEGSVGGSA